MAVLYRFILCVYYKVQVVFLLHNTKWSQIPVSTKIHSCFKIVKKPTKKVQVKPGRGKGLNYNQTFSCSFKCEFKLEFV